MYGNHVHKKVIEEKEKISGITIHLVNPRYDEGDILFQATCAVYSTDTISSLANRIHSLEYLYFPQIIESFCKSYC
jgi:phosphoribosylglycinamide formyltransferase-1